MTTPSTPSSTPSTSTPSTDGDSKSSAPSEARSSEFSVAGGAEFSGGAGNQPRGPSLSLSKKGRWFALGSLVVAASAFAMIAGGGLGENLVYYWGPSELLEKGSQAIGPTIRLGGQVEEGSIEFDESSSALRFSVSDGKASVAVRSVGVPPQMFRENIGVIVEGNYTKEGYFKSERLMVSHGNEYQVPGEGEEVNTYELMKTARSDDEPSGAYGSAGTDTGDIAR